MSTSSRYVGAGAYAGADPGGGLTTARSARSARSTRDLYSAAPVSGRRSTREGLISARQRRLSVAPVPVFGAGGGGEDDDGVPESLLEYNDAMETVVAVFEAFAGKGVEAKLGCAIPT